MKSIAESGIVTTVNNFEDLISFCTGYGPSYNPTKVAIRLPGLNSTFILAKSKLQIVKTARTAFDDAVNPRVIAIKPLKKLCTRIVNALDATDASKEKVADARSINRKIQGKRAPGPLPADPEHKQISVSQQSYDYLIDNFAKLIVCVSTEPLYNPNEIDLKVTTLNNVLTNLKTLNTAVITATTPYSNAMIDRNAVLYAADTGLVDLALEVKKYVKSLYGAASPQYKQIAPLKFRRYSI